MARLFQFVIPSHCAGLYEDWEVSHLSLSDTHRDWFTRHHSMVVAMTEEQQNAESGKVNKTRGDSRDVVLGWAGLAAVQVAEGKWREAKNSLEKGVTNA